MIKQLWHTFTHTLSSGTLALITVSWLPSEHANGYLVCLDRDCVDVGTLTKWDFHSDVAGEHKVTVVAYNQNGKTESEPIIIGKALCPGEKSGIGVEGVQNVCESAATLNTENEKLKSEVVRLQAIAHHPDQKTFCAHWKACFMTAQQLWEQLKGEPFPYTTGDVHCPDE